MLSSVFLLPLRSFWDIPLYDIRQVVHAALKYSRSAENGNIGLWWQRNVFDESTTKPSLLKRIKVIWSGLFRRARKSDSVRRASSDSSNIVYDPRKHPPRVRVPARPQHIWPETSRPVPSLPQELIDAIIEHLAEDGNRVAKHDVSICGLVCSSWAPVSQRYLFRNVNIYLRWFEPQLEKIVDVLFQPQSRIPSYVRTLRISFGTMGGPREPLDGAALVILGKLPQFTAVTYLIIAGIRWPELDTPTRTNILNLIAPLKGLQLDHATFPNTSDDALRFISQASNLEELSIMNLKSAESSSDSDALPPTMLRTLELVLCDGTKIFTWVTKHSNKSIHTLTLGGGFPPADIGILDRLEALQSIIFNDYNFASSLSIKNAFVTTMTFHKVITTSAQYFTWIADVLRRCTLPALEEVTIDIRKPVPRLAVPSFINLELLMLAFPPARVVGMGPRLKFLGDGKALTKANIDILREKCAILNREGRLVF